MVTTEGLGGSICCARGSATLLYPRAYIIGCFCSDMSFELAFAAMWLWRIPASSCERLQICFIPRLRHCDKRRRNCIETFINVACWNSSFMMDPVTSYVAGFDPLLFVYKRLLA